MAALALLLVVVELVHGWRVLGSAWQGGDLLYHSALANAVLRGELPPGGPYAGLPAYYPPGFHVLLAAVMGLAGLDAAHADQLLTLAWLPVLPIGTFLLVRRLTGRPWVAILAVALTAFGGAYDLNADRLWVNSLFMAGHEAYPLYPRDVVFGLLPFAVLAFLRALDAPGGRTALGWTAVAGALLGVCGLVQVQLLLPIPFALAAVAVVVAVRHPARRGRSLAILVAGGLIGLLVIAPWLIGQLASIRQNGGVALESAANLLPARFGPWSYPRELGLLLPFGLVGAGAALLFLRRPDGPRPAGRSVGPWSPAVAEEPVVLVAWFGVAFLLGVAYQPDWPLEDALRPQRLYLLASQPMTMLAAIGLLTAIEDLAARWRPGRVAPRQLAVGLVGLAVVAACVPTTVATVGLLANTWTTPAYAALDLAADRVPSFDRILPTRGPRSTVLTYEDWSSLAWYETGSRVVGLLPAGFAKLAYDPAIFTPRSQAGRRADLLRAFDGDPADLAATAADYDAARIVLARRDGAVGLFDAALAPTIENGAIPAGSVGRLDGNGWDALTLQPGATISLPIRTRGLTHLEIRLAATPLGTVPAGPARLILRPVRADRSVGDPIETGVSTIRPGPWQIVSADVDLSVATAVRIEARDPVAIQSVRGFVRLVAAPEVGAVPLPGWRVVEVTPDALVLEPVP